jgi:hypothetical protein
MSYPTIVQLHVLGALLFIVAHAVSAVLLFVIRAQRDAAGVRRYLRASQVAMIPAYIGLLLLIVAGAWAGIESQAFTSGRLWLWAAVVVLVVVIGAMYATMTPTFGRWRQLVAEGAQPVTETELTRALRVPGPLIGALIGVFGLVLLLWLMYAKPF